MGKFKKGNPPKILNEEWFLAKLKDGQYACLKFLPENFTYMYRDANDTHYSSDWIVEWAQMPNSEYKLD